MYKKCTGIVCITLENVQKISFFRTFLCASNVLNQMKNLDIDDWFISQGLDLQMLKYFISIKENTECTILILEYLFPSSF